MTQADDARDRLKRWMRTGWMPRGWNLDSDLDALIAGYDERGERITTLLGAIALGRTAFNRMADERDKAEADLKTLRDAVEGHVKVCGELSNRLRAVLAAGSDAGGGS